MQVKRRDLLCFVNVDIVASYQWTKMVSIFVWLMGMRLTLLTVRNGVLVDQLPVVGVIELMNLKKSGGMDK